MPLLERARKAWNAFRYDDKRTPMDPWTTGPSYSVRQDRAPMRFANERSIVSAVYTRIGIDTAGIPVRHVKVDDQERYSDDMDSRLNNCLLLEPNLDQSPRAFRQDLFMTLFDHGVAALVPVDTVNDPTQDMSFDVETMRIGEIKEWFARHIRVSVYNVDRGKREDITLEKRYVSIVENPLYAVMNEPNSTLQRLLRKLQLLDVVDEQAGSGKLDLIIQLPYTIKSEARRQQAENRRKDIEFQLKGSQYGIAYTDGTEKITQLNRPAENNMLAQVEYLTNMLYSQLGITEEVMNGTADEATMATYFVRTIQPLLDALTEAMNRTLLGKPAIRRGERVMYFRDPFKLVPIADLAEIADKFARNEILTANEIRSFMGLKPSEDPNADKLINSNMPKQEDAGADSSEDSGDDGTDAALAELETMVDEVFDSLGVDAGEFD